MTAPARLARERETRLLVTTLVLSAGMLLLLSRFRFPDKPSVADAAPVATPAPLERLAARATYGELANILGGLDAQLAPILVPVRFAADVATGRDLDLPAIRIAAERAVALIGRGADRSGLVTSPDVQGLLAVDAPRGVALVKVSALKAEPWREVDAAEPIAAPAYAASVEMTPRGRAVRPFYFGRVDREADASWGGTLLRFSGLQQQPPRGAAIFLLDGRFVGMGAPDNSGAFVVVPAALLRDAAQQLESGGSIDLADLGLEVAPLTEDLSLALNAEHGVVITHVVPEGPSQRALRAGDVIQRIADQDVQTVPQYTAALARLPSGKETPLSVRRRGTALDVTIVPAARGRIVAETSRQLGLDLRVVSGVGVEVVRVSPRSAGAMADLRSGDVITALDDDEAPTPAAIRRAFDRAVDGARLVAAVQRGRDHHILVLAKP